jgi:hypothetical protein
MTTTNVVLTYTHLGCGTMQRVPVHMPIFVLFQYATVFETVTILMRMERAMFGIMKSTHFRQQTTFVKLVEAQLDCQPQAMLH